MTACERRKKKKSAKQSEEAQTHQHMAHAKKRKEKKRLRCDVLPSTIHMLTNIQFRHCNSSAQCALHFTLPNSAQQHCDAQQSIASHRMTADAV